MKKIFSLLTIVALVSTLLGPVLTPQTAHAATVQSSAVKFVGCATGNIAGVALASAIAPLVGKLKAKLSPGGIIDALTTVPVSDSSTQGYIDAGNIQFLTKNYITDVVARCGARVLLDTIISSTFSIMRTAGRDGGVTFVTNWTNFETNAQYRGENIFRAELSTAKLCDYLSTDVKKSFGVDPKTKTPITGQNVRTGSLQPFSLQTNCTLPAGFTPTKYQQDFAGQGGWDTFVRLLEPQNNAYGLTIIAQNEIEKQRALAVSADVNQVTANNGYVGISGTDKNSSCAVKAPSGTDCIVYNNIKTTGSYIAQNVAAGINAELSWITSAQGLGSLIANATEVLLNRLLDQGNSDEGSYRATNDTTLPNLNLPTDPAPAACTSTGASEQAFMLPLLNGGTDPQTVATQTNTQFNLLSGSQAVYYADSNTVGLPEFYMAGPTPTRPVSPATGAPWDVVVRCTTQPTGGTGGGNTPNGGASDTNPAI